MDSCKASTAAAIKNGDFRSSDGRQKEVFLLICALLFLMNFCFLLTHINLNAVLRVGLPGWQCIITATYNFCLGDKSLRTATLGVCLGGTSVRIAVEMWAGINSTPHKLLYERCTGTQEILSRHCSLLTRGFFRPILVESRYSENMAGTTSYMCSALCHIRSRSSGSPSQQTRSIVL